MPGRYMCAWTGAVGLLLWTGVALSAQPGKAPGETRAASAQTGKVAVINACGTADVSAEVAADLRDAGFTVAKVGKVPASTEVTRIVYQPSAEKLALEVSKRILGDEKLIKASTPIPDADILITVGCRTAQALRDARAKLLKETRLAVINTCGTADASAQLAAGLRDVGFTVAKVGKVPASTEVTRIVYQPSAEKLALEVSKMVPGAQKLVKAASPTPGADILLTVGCETARVALSKKTPFKAPLPTVARAGAPKGIFPSANGCSGLIASHTADVLPMGSYGASGFIYSTFHMLPDEYKNVGIKSGGVGGLPSQDVDLQMSFNWGIARRVEAGLMFPVSLASGIKGGFGLRNIRLMGKFSLYDNPQRPTKVTASAFVGIPSASGDMGSGSMSGGIEGNVSYPFGEGQRYSLNGNVGFELADYISKAFPGKKYESAGKLDLSGSLSYLAIEKLLVSIEFLYSSAMGKGSPGEIIPFGDDDLFSVIGLRILPTKTVAVGIGGGFGIPFDTLRDDTNYVVIAGGSYLFGKTAGAAVALPEAAPKPVQPPVQPQKPSLVPPPTPPPQAIAPAPPPPPRKKAFKDMRVDIKDACGRPGIRETVGKALITKGFNVVRIGDAPQRGATLTEIIYIKEYEPEALSLRKTLKGTPKLTPVASGEAEIAVLVGCDQAP